MSSKPSKQLGALLNRVPPATASSANLETARPTLVPYAPEPPAAHEPAPKRAAEPPPVADEPEVPLQVLVPRHVRIQLDRMRAESRKSLRILLLEALQGIGITVTDEDIAGKRGRKKS